MIRVVLDANVIVSAVLKPSSVPGRILELVRQKHVVLLMSPDILAEVRAVLRYPRLKKLHGRGSRWISAFVRELSEVADITPGVLVVDAIKDDPSDNIYLACAVEGKAHYVISGDRHLKEVGVFEGISVVDPAMFLRAVGIA